MAGSTIIKLIHCVLFANANSCILLPSAFALLSEFFSSRFGVVPLFIDLDFSWSKTIVGWVTTLRFIPSFLFSLAMTRYHWCWQSATWTDVLTMHDIRANRVGLNLIVRLCPTPQWSWLYAKPFYGLCIRSLLSIARNSLPCFPFLHIFFMLHS